MAGPDGGGGCGAAAAGGRRPRRAEAGGHARLPLADDGRRRRARSKRWSGGCGWTRRRSPWSATSRGRGSRRRRRRTPRYWARHTRETVRFDRGVAELLRGTGRVLVEVRPRADAVDLRPPARRRGRRCPSSPPSATRTTARRTPRSCWARSAGSWLAGVTPDWAAFHAGRAAEPRAAAHLSVGAAALLDRGAAAGRRRTPPGRAAGARPIPAEWLYVPSWRRTAAPRPAFGDGRGAGVRGRFAALRRRGGWRCGRTAASPLVVRPGEAFARTAEGWTVRPASREDHRKLVDALAEDGGVPATVLHLWGVDDARGRRPGGRAGAGGCAGPRAGGVRRCVAVTARRRGGERGGGGGCRARPRSSAPRRVLRVETPTVAPRGWWTSRCRRPTRTARAMGGARRRGGAGGGRARGGAARAAPLGARLRRGAAGAGRARRCCARAACTCFIGGLRGRNELLAEHLIRRYGARHGADGPHAPAPRRLGPRGQGAPGRRTRCAGRSSASARWRPQGAEMLTIQVLPSEAEQMRDAAARRRTRTSARCTASSSPRWRTRRRPREAVAEVRVAAWERRMGHLLGELPACARRWRTAPLDFVVVESSLTARAGRRGGDRTWPPRTPSSTPSPRRTAGDAHAVDERRVGPLVRRRRGARGATGWTRTRPPPPSSTC